VASELFGRWRMDDLGEIVLHVMVETAWHAGHLDAAREPVDGWKWLVLTERRTHWQIRSTPASAGPQAARDVQREQAMCRNRW